jgi:hypothetical protein
MVQGSSAEVKFNGTAVDINTVGSYGAGIIRVKSPHLILASFELLTESIPFGPFPYGEYSCVIYNIGSDKYVELGEVVIYTWSNGSGDAYV